MKKTEILNVIEMNEEQTTGIVYSNPEKQEMVELEGDYIGESITVNAKLLFEILRTIKPKANFDYTFKVFKKRKSQNKVLVIEGKVIGIVAEIKKNGEVKK